MCHNFQKYSRPIVAVIAGLLAVFAVGCADTPADTAKNNAAPAPLAKPGATIGVGNPAAGQPNHMSPEMQEQMKRYQSQSKK